MVQIATVRRRPWADAAWLIIIVAGVLLALAFGNTFVLLAALAVALLSSWLVLRGQAPVLASARPLAAHVEGPARVQRSVVLADGTARQALVVPATAADGYQTVLTINGYALINGEGRVVYAFKRELPDQANEPVVVTIVDAE